METPDANPNVLTLLDDKELSKAPDSHLLARVAAGEPQVQHLVAIITSAGSQAIHIAVSMGQCLEVLFKRHEGEFTEWLSMAFPLKPDGSDYISDDTARRYRTLWRKRDLVFPPDGSPPTCRNLTEAFIKVGAIPEPDENTRDPHQLPPPFRLSFHLPEGDPSNWAPAVRRDFLTRAEPVAKAYEAAKLV